MTRRALSPAKGQAKPSPLFAEADTSKHAPDDCPNDRSVRLQRQLILLQKECDRLVDENRRLATAAALSPLGFCELDTHGLILQANTVFAAMVQTEMHLLKGIAFVSFLPDRFHQKFLSFVHHVMHAEGTHTIEIPIVTTRGEDYVVRMNSRRSDHCRPAVAFCALTEIANDPLRAHPAGNAEKDGFRTIAENSPSWKMWFGEDGGLLWVNAAVERLTGYSPQECYAMSDFPSPLIAAADRGTVAELIGEALHGGEGRDREFQFHRKDGEDVWGTMAFSPIFSADGAPLGFWVSVRSIARSKELEAELTASNLVLEEQIQLHTEALQKKNRSLRKDLDWHIGFANQLEASERRFRQLWECSLDGMILVNQQGIIETVNESYCRLAGMPRELVIGKPALCIFKTDERTFFGTLKERSHGGTTELLVMEREFRMWDERVVWLELLTMPFPGDEGDKLMLVIMRDSTARKRSEEKVMLLNQALENRLQDRLTELDSMNVRLTAEMRERIEGEDWVRNFLYHCPIVMYIKDTRACMLLANTNFERMFGMDPNTIVGKSNKELWGDEFGEVVDRQDFDVLKADAAKEFLDTINGRMYLTVKFPIRRKDLPPLLGGYVQDVTAVIAEERALKLSRQFFERILNALGDPVCVKNKDHRYVLVNDSFVDFTGIPRDTIIGKLDPELFNSDVSEMIDSSDDAVLEKQREFLIEEVFTRRDGVQRRILVKKDIYFDEYDKPFIVNVIRDITEMRKEEDEIRSALARERELNELKSRFVSMVSHEYKTPLTAILSSAELLELFRKSWSDEKVNTHLVRIKRAVETMIEMISDALFLNKMETGWLVVSPNTFELVSYCIMVADEVQACTPGQNKIEFSSTVTNALVSVDNKLLRYIFTNLLSNAVKYSFPDTIIHFDTSVAGQTGTFRVTNRGIGIPSDARDRLFEPFFRASNIGTIPGTGLGLSIVKRCIDALQGAITVESIPNETTAFTVTLPLHVLDQASEPARRDRFVHTG